MRRSSGKAQGKLAVQSVCYVNEGKKAKGGEGRRGLWLLVAPEEEHLSCLHP